MYFKKKSDPRGRYEWTQGRPRALDVVVIWSRIAVSLGQWKWAIQENVDFTHDSDNRSLFKTQRMFYAYIYLCNYQYKKLYVLTNV